MKAQGNQLTKLKVKEIVLTQPLEGEETWPVEEKPLKLEDDDSDDDEGDDGEEGSDGTTIEWDLTKDDEDDDQMKLF